MIKKLVLTKFNMGTFILLISFVTIFLNIQNITKFCFDEYHYVPAAREWLDFAPNNNLEHPPLGKYLIAISIKSFGDNPVGWRMSSVLSGTMSVYLCFLISILLFKDILFSGFIALFTLFNFWIFVQSRIGMLDIFSVCFILGALYFYLESLISSNNLKFLFLGSLMWGLSIAVKWSAIYVYLPFFMIIFFKNIKNFKNTLLMGGISVLVYFLTFIPYAISNGRLHYTILEIFTKIPFEMLGLQKQVPGTHPYSSQFYTWPFMIRPIWYEYISNIRKGYFQGIVLLGNPIQMFLGVLSVILLILKNNRAQKVTQATLSLFLVSWLFWAIVPRKLTLFYYFFPSAMFYSFLIPMTLNEFLKPKTAKYLMGIFTLISMCLFIYFYPILSGTFTLESELNKWMWFNGWI